MGEPPLMLAASAAAALQAAARAGHAELASLGALEGGEAALIQLPARPDSLVAAMSGAHRQLAAAFAQ
jgi:hypothetical protein